MRWVYRALKKYCSLVQSGYFGSKEMFGADEGPQGYRYKKKIKIVLGTRSNKEKG